MKTLEHLIPNGDGWQLSLFQTWDEARLVPGRRPVLIVPGYGMNSFIFSYHPRGLSLEGYLAEAGFEVWRVDLRGQGGSRSVGGGDAVPPRGPGRSPTSAPPSTRCSTRTRTGAVRVDVLGASLGGTIMFAHAVLEPDHRHRVDGRHRQPGALGARSTRSSASPSPRRRWSGLRPLARHARASPSCALPLLARRTPWLLSIYMNPEITDTARRGEMVKTVEDPNRHVNRQIAHWIRDRDLVLRGVNVSEALGSHDEPAALRPRLRRRHRPARDGGVPLPRGGLRR